MLSLVKSYILVPNLKNIRNFVEFFKIVKNSWKNTKFPRFLKNFERCGYSEYKSYMFMTLFPCFMYHVCWENTKFEWISSWQAWARIFVFITMFPCFICHTRVGKIFKKMESNHGTGSYNYGSYRSRILKSQKGFE